MSQMIRIHNADVSYFREPYAQTVGSAAALHAAKNHDAEWNAPGSPGVKRIYGPPYSSLNMEICDILVEGACRASPEQIRELAAGISDVGLLSPIVIAAASSRLVSGRRRLLACELLRWTRIPVLVRYDLGCLDNTGHLKAGFRLLRAEAVRNANGRKPLISDIVHIAERLLQFAYEAICRSWSNSYPAPYKAAAWDPLCYSEAATELGREVAVDGVCRSPSEQMRFAAVEAARSVIANVVGISAARLTRACMIVDAAYADCERFVDLMEEMDMKDEIDKVYEKLCIRQATFERRVSL